MNSFQNHNSTRKNATQSRQPKRSLGHRFRWLLGHVEPVAPLVSRSLVDCQADCETDFESGIEREVWKESVIGDTGSGPSQFPPNQAPASQTEIDRPTNPLQRERRSISCVIEANTPIPKPVPRKIEHRVETLRPIVSLAFVFPLVLIYEIGVIIFHTDVQGMRVGIDHWVQQFLATFGAGKLVVLPLLTLAILLFWHHRIHDRWQFKFSTMVGLLAEAIGLGVILAAAAHLTGLMVFGQTPAAAVGMLDLIRDPVWCSQAIACIGAGIYEELVFRVLFFLPLATWLAYQLKDETVALVASMLIVSALFAIVHYDIVNPAGESFQAPTFMFRFAGSMIFCLLFKFRGLAIAVGTHVVFDVLMLS